MYILALKIVFVSLTHQELILHENVKQKKVLLKYYLQLFYLIFLFKLKSCQVIAKKRPFFIFFAVFRRYLVKYCSQQKIFNRKRCILISFSRQACIYQLKIYFTRHYAQKSIFLNFSLCSHFFNFSSIYLNLESTLRYNYRSIFPPSRLNRLKIH